MVFHEITPTAIARAVDEWRELDRRLVDAQEARRILDRLYGYEVSPVLWRKVMPRLSAGRVQSVATRMVVERERARMRFRSATWWGVEGTFTNAEAPSGFGAALVGLGGTAIATGKDFDEHGERTGKSDVRVLAEDEATSVATALVGRPFTVSAVTERPFRRSPAAPFMTSTLQQEAGRKLRFSAQRAMQVAQRLYEQGFITYMRTDSTTLSDEALTAARSQAREMYGDAYVPDGPRRYERKVKNAQEAHEAIRPSGETFRTPEQAGRDLSGDELRLYELIWKRTVASQMNDATGTSAQIRLTARVPEGTAEGQEAEFSASGRVIAFPGFLRAYVEGEDDPDAELADREVVLPALAVGDVVEGKAFEPGSHTTQPPARYTEASLVKAMEELGVGRPSTYASVIATILDRGYVWKKGTALVPSFTAFAVVGLLERYFGNLVDYGFTASMEDDLDEIAAGTRGGIALADPLLLRLEWARWGQRARRRRRLGRSQGLRRHASERDRCSRDQLHPPRATGATVSRLWPGSVATARTSSTARIAPRSPTTWRPTSSRSSEPKRSSLRRPTTGCSAWIPRADSTSRSKQGDSARTSRWATSSRAATSRARPRSSRPWSRPRSPWSRPSSCCRSRRVIGTDPETNEDVVAHNGRFGPYLKRGSDTRSLASEEQLLTVTLAEAQALFAQPKQRRGRAAAAPLRELGTDPSTNLPVVVKDGRFGPYVTDGTTNASLRKGDAVESIDIERASELLGERRAAGPSTRKKKAAKKAAPAKKKAAAKKAPVKKKATKKAAGAKKAVGTRGGGARDGRLRRNEGCTDRTVLRWGPGGA